MSDHGRAHAVLSPSSAERWMDCPASVGLIESQGRADDGTSEWAEEGTRAHSLAEIEASYAFGLTTETERDALKVVWAQTALAHGDDIEEMERHARSYVSFLKDLAADLDGPITARFELRVRTGVPGCWGTVDTCLIGATRIVVVDYKYGQGVTVDVEGNPQLMLYSVGALELVDLLGTVETVDMWVYQPRAGGESSYTVSAEGLRAWRDLEVLPVALETRDPNARFGPSERACRWCPVAGACKARATWTTRRDFGDPRLLDETELAEAWLALPAIRDWCNAVEAETLRQAYSEKKTLPGLKVVLSGGKRSIPDAEAAIEALVAAGYERSAVARESTQTLAALERLVGGSERLSAVLGDLLTKGQGRPSVVSADDPRPEVNKMTEAQEDFRG